jgi:hypothetical protein
VDDFATNVRRLICFHHSTAREAVEEIHVVDGRLAPLDL